MLSIILVVVGMFIVILITIRLVRKRLGSMFKVVVKALVKGLEILKLELAL